MGREGGTYSAIARLWVRDCGVERVRELQLDRWGTSPTERSSFAERCARWSYMCA